MLKLILQCLMLAFSLSWASFAVAQVRTYHLYIDQKMVKINGKAVQKLSINGQFPAPTLSFEEGDEAVIIVHNQLKQAQTALHWHGLLLPGMMDGVPGLNGFQSIAPNGVFSYRFKLRQNGTYWYHAHSREQEQDGLYGAFVVYPKGKIPLTHTEQVQQDYVLMLSEFHPSSGAQILKNLKKSAEYYQNQRETLADVWQQVHRDGLVSTWQNRKMWNQMRMLRTDLSDVTGYTFLVNGKTAAQNWQASFNTGDKIRLRIINASAMSFFDVRIPGLKMTVVAADGQAVQPVSVDEFRIGTAETYDVIVEPKHSQYQIQAESIDRSGFALASIVAQGHQIVTQPAPLARPRALLSMQDMPMSAMDPTMLQQHTGHAQAVSQHSGVAVSTEETTTQASAPTQDKAQHAQAMHHAAHADSATAGSAAMDHSAMHHAEQHPQHAQPAHLHTVQQVDVAVEGWANASTPQGHKALHYSDLKSLYPQSDLRTPDKTLLLNLGGSMERYIWTINGEKIDQATPLKVNYGERVRLQFVNHSMMAHPMHLHGMFVQLENGQALRDLPNKHTIIVPPNKTVTVLLTANELGEWAIHCHLLYHMAAGMMNTLIVANVEDHQPAEQSTMLPAAQGASHAHHH